MNCPKCSRQMIQGTYELKGNIFTWSILGISQKELYFYSNNSDQILAVGFGEIKLGYFCRNCETYVILKNDVKPQSIEDM